MFSSQNIWNCVQTNEEREEVDGVEVEELGVEETRVEEVEGEEVEELGFEEVRAGPVWPFAGPSIGIKVTDLLNPPLSHKAY